MRAQIETARLQTLFEAVKQASGTSWGVIAKELNISSRHLFDIRRGKTTVPGNVLALLENMQGTQLVGQVRILDDNWSKSESGRLGAKQRILLYGNPGTSVGRSLGGKRAILTQQKSNTSFFCPRVVTLPKHSNALAECIGSILGDGCVSQYQICVTLHAKDDKEYAKYLKQLFDDLFASSVSMRVRKNVILLVLSRVALVRYLASMELDRGNKVRQQIAVPQWITISKKYSKRCARGLFDTDGCVYTDTHHKGSKTYKNITMAFSNHSLPLLHFYKTTLEAAGLHPTQKTKYSVFLRRESEIFEYFKIVGSSNPKHLNKAKRFFAQKYGGVAKWS